MVILIKSSVQGLIESGVYVCVCVCVGGERAGRRMQSKY